MRRTVSMLLAAMPATAPAFATSLEQRVTDSRAVAALGELYPEDRATGYTAGQIRGAFTISQPM